MTSKLVLDSIKNALLSSDYPKSLTLHSDLGTQYTSDIVMNFCKNNNITQSFSNKGNPYDNACIESFHSILKKEEVHHRIYYNLQEARRSIFEFIESWYNNERIHSSIDYKTPNEFHYAS